MSDYEIHEFDDEDDGRNLYEPSILWMKQSEFKPIVKFTKHTLAEICDMVMKRGLWYTQGYVKDMIRKYKQDGHILYMNTLPDYRKCLEFLHKLEKEHKEFFSSEGGCWGDFHELKVVNIVAINALFKEEQNKYSFGSTFEYDKIE